MKVVIIGAGIGGLALAVACRRENLEVVVLERAPALEPRENVTRAECLVAKTQKLGAGIQVPPNAARVARQLGVLPALKEKGVVLDSIEYVRYTDGKVLYKMDKNYVRDSFRDTWLADLHQAFWDAAKEAGAELRLGSEMTSIDFQNSCVNLVGGEEVTGDVIVGADGTVGPHFCYVLRMADSAAGLYSRARDLILGRESPATETGDLAYRCTVPVEMLKGLNDQALSSLLEKKTATCWMGPDRHCVFYPLKGGKEYNLIMLRPDNLPKDVRRAPGDLNEMRSSFEGWDPRLTKLISCVPSVLKWKLSHHKELESWACESVVLLGDACHPTLPYQAQGAAMAVEDGAVLGKLLGLLNQSEVYKSQAPRRLSNMLKLYESLRKARTSNNVQGAISNRYTYHLLDGPEQEARDAWLASSRTTPPPDGQTLGDHEYLKTMLAFDCVTDSIEAFKEWERKLTKLARQL
ncbi:hypothetical protein CEK26_012494 [Fusarium fujikuroi]|uniref:Uncharacterized protein n=1 Tax=Fusarium fujikuroi TaxID=5127 RepID=A0A5Q3F5L7_FUSFU|nr:hypothetical protein CEK27_012504 [Fusarium fujikuroi]QGI85729.1 hypothetical protein CEK25_012458 [Fusarium fujikuroi]QGI99425.1 hypothetical protein CEK26_012494 [Fusarium fujikuroi]VTT60465.1 unnamed protein product [Fusarium fujikuroi]VTT69500.1 unnamed protein product [Fusarium fujikuroi]